MAGEWSLAISFDQADWADARVTLADGKTVWLGDLPTGPLRAPFTAEVPFSFRYGDRPSSYLLKMWELASQLPAALTTTARSIR